MYFNQCSSFTLVSFILRSPTSTLILFLLSQVGGGLAMVFIVLFSICCCNSDSENRFDFV